MRINSVQIILIARIRHKRLCFRNAKYFSIEERETETRSEISNAGALERESWNAKKLLYRNAECKGQIEEIWHAGCKGISGKPRPPLTRIPRTYCMRYTTISDSDTTYLWDTRPSLTRIPRTYEILYTTISDSETTYIPMRYTTISDSYTTYLWDTRPSRVSAGGVCESEHLQI